jgi:hypothetical protein
MSDALTFKINIDSNTAINALNNTDKAIKGVKTATDNLGKVDISSVGENFKKGSEQALRMAQSVSGASGKIGRASCRERVFLRV